MQQQLEAKLGGGLSFLAGFVDTLGFIALKGVFTAHVTGNFVLVGAQLTHFSQKELLRLAVLPAFIAGVALSGWLHGRGWRWGALLRLQSALLIIFWASGQFQAPELMIGMAGALAMGIQNAISRLPDSLKQNTTVMTGNVTQAVLDAVTGQASKSWRSWSLVLWFTLGALLGAGFYAQAGYAALLGAALICLALSVLPPGNSNG